MVNDAPIRPSVRFFAPPKSRHDNTTMRAAKAVTISALLLQFALAMGAACCRRPKTEPLIDVMPIQN